ncbi:MAG: hypothetical protein Q4G33_02160 [bacterium]|nr:hypothetical protein [bacterium]
MRKLKKIIALCLTSMAAISATCVNSVFAEKVMPLPGGGEFVIYEEGDKLPMVAYARTADFDFNQTFPIYPRSSFLLTPYTENSVKNVIPLGEGERNIHFTFDSAPRGCYVWLYNVTTGKYELDGEAMGGLVDKNYGFRNLPAGNTYRIRFSGTDYNAVTLSGNCATY